VPFGQYVPGDSPVHRLDARVKLALVVAYTVVLFSSRDFAGLCAAALAAFAAVVIAQVPWRLALRGLVPVLWLLLFTLAANTLRWQPVASPVRLGPLGVSETGLVTGLFFAMRIVLLVVGTSVALTDALSTLMGPLRHVGVPVDDAAMMFSIALRFVPTTAEEAEKIVVAQSARGAVFDRGGPVTRARAWVPVLVPLFVNLFRRADDLAVAMESRCYVGRGRTRLREARMGVGDWAVLVVGVTLATAATILFR
jgi:energy-coupling factor transport system permease protein